MRRKRGGEGRGISKELIYEMRHGKLIYYRDYDKVLSGEKTLEEVMGNSKLPSFLISAILRFLFSNLSQKKICDFF